MAVHAIQFGTLDLTDEVESYDEGRPTRLNAQLVPKRHGALISEVPVYEPRRIRMTGRVIKDTKEDLRSRIRTIESFGLARRQLRIFDDRFYNAYMQNFTWSYVEGSALLVAEFSLDFLCDDPFEYDNNGTSVVVTLTSSDTAVGGGQFKKSFTLTNSGSAFAFFTSTCAADQGGAVTNSIIRNNTLSPTRLNQYTGTVVVSTSVVIANGDFTVKNNGTDDLVNFAGSFLWIETGANSMEVEGHPATYTFEWTPRHV